MSFSNPLARGPVRAVSPPLRRPAGAPGRVGVGTSPVSDPFGFGTLAPGATAPAYTLVRPANVSSAARWAGPQQPGLGWRGVGGGWWSPSGGVSTRTAPIDNPAFRPSPVALQRLAALLAQSR